jgi:hypothetical protein
MKNSLRLFAASLCLTTAPLFAGPVVETTTAATDETSVLPIEFILEGAYIGESDVERGFRENRDFTEIYSHARFIYRPLTKVGYLRLGADWERFDFDGFDRFIQPISSGSLILGEFDSQLPETLQSVSAVIGLDTKLSDSFLIRLEAMPGLYGTEDLDSDTFNVPFVLGGSYIYSSDLQFIFGVSVNYERAWAVLPGGGFRWRFASNWVLNAAAPTPRLEFEMSRNLTLYAGADLKGTTVRVDENFGETRRDDRLNNAVLTYTEIRTGGGLDWKITPQMKLSLEGGYVPHRNFDYHRANVRYKHEQGAPYGALSFRAAF